MIILDKKSYELLFYLLKLEEPETVMAISKKLKQSRRKIYYHLDKINQALPPNMAPIVSYPRIGICLTPEQKVVCQGLVNGVGHYNYVLHVGERLQLMLTYIAVAKERVTIEKLMALTDVSRNTVLNDLNLIRKNLTKSPHKITLEVTKAAGYYLHAPLLIKIRYFHQLLHTIYTQGNANFIAMLRDKIASAALLEDYFSTTLLTCFQDQLYQARENLGKTLNGQESELMLNTLPYLLNSYRNMILSQEELAHIQREFLPIKQRKEYGIAKDIAQGLEQQLGVQLDDVEICLISMLLLSYRKDSDKHLDSPDYAQMRKDLKDFLDQFESTYQLCFSQKEELLKQLLTHCKSLIYRKTYGVLSNNPLTRHIINKYAELFQMTKASVIRLQEAWQISLTDDDIAYITVHLGGALRSQQLTHKPHVILICDEGIGAQKLFLLQCKRYLKGVTIGAVFTSEQFDNVRDALQADAIISTVELGNSHIPSLVVNPILSHDDIVRMVQLVGQQTRRSHLDLGQELEACLRQHLTSETTVSVLKTKLEKLLYQEMLAILAVTQDQSLIHDT